MSSMMTGYIRRGVSSWLKRHPALRALLRLIWWLCKHPFITAGLGLFVLLFVNGWFVVSAAIIGVLIPASPWLLRLLRRFGTPGGGRFGMRNSVTYMSRRRQLTRSWEWAAINAGIHSRDSDKRVPRLMNVADTGVGVNVTIACGTVGVTSDEVVAAGRKLAASIAGCKDVTVLPGSNPGFAQIHFMWEDPLSEPIGLNRLPYPPKGQLSYGITGQDKPATIIDHRSLLVVGISGSGKSNAVWALLVSLLITGTPFRLRVIDPAGGVELSALKDSPLVVEYTDRPDGAEDVVKHAHRAMEARLAAMSGNSRLHKPTSEEPLDITIIDEVLLLTGMLKDGAKSPAGQILTIGRKAGFSIWALTQIPHIDTMGRIRTLFPQKLVLATESREMTEAALGSGAEGRGARCSSISPKTPGVGYASVEGSRGFQRFRVVFVTDDDVEMVARGRVPHMAPTSNTTGNVKGKTHVLYGWYSPNGELLYVGISNNGTRRAAEHAKNKTWAHQQGVTMRVLEVFSSREAALRAEKTMISTSRPFYNIQHNH